MEIKKKKKIVGMISNIILDLPLSRNQPLKLADD
jgi:hypothetical protein